MTRFFLMLCVVASLCGASEDASAQNLAHTAPAMILKVPLSNAMKGGTFYVKFSDETEQAQYVGSLHIGGVTMVKKNISLNGQTITCRRQINGYYFNTARGVLLPLSAYSKGSQYAKVHVDGGIYTSCVGDRGVTVDPMGLFGRINYSYQNNSNRVSLGSLLMGFDINTQTNKILHFSVQKPISWSQVNGLNGTLYDTFYGYGTVEQDNQLDPDKNINDQFGDLLGLMSNIYIQGYAGLGLSMDKLERNTLTKNLASLKTLVTNNNDAISATYINTANKNAQLLCKEYITSSSSQSHDPILCFQEGFTLNSSNFDQYKNKTIVVKKGNVIIDRSVYNRFDANSFLTLYVMKGHLILDSNINDPVLKSFDNNGYLTTQQLASKQGLFLHGNFIVNGLLLAAKDGNVTNDLTAFPYKTYLHGKLFTLNPLNPLNIKRDDYLGTTLSQHTPTFSTLNTTNTFYANGTWDPSLSSLFTRRCEEDLSDPDNPKAISTAHNITGYNTTSQNLIKAIQCIASDPYSLTIVDKDIPTRILE